MASSGSAESITSAHVAAKVIVVMVMFNLGSSDVASDVDVLFPKEVHAAIWDVGSLHSRVLSDIVPKFSHHKEDGNDKADAKEPDWVYMEIEEVSAIPFLSDQSDA